MTDLFDILLFQHEDIGTTIKIEDDVYGIFSYIPITYYKQQKKFDKFFSKFDAFLLEKIEKNYKGKNDKILKELLLGDENGNFKAKIGLIINERAMNLPEEVIPPAMGLITKELGECQVEEGYDQRYEFDYLLIISKFVKLINTGKKGKKRNLGNDSNYDNIAYYKFETPLYIEKSEFSFEYKIPYLEKGLENLENQNEPQFVNITLIKKENYLKVLKNKLQCDI